MAPILYFQGEFGCNQREEREEKEEEREGELVTVADDNVLGITCCGKRLVISLGTMLFFRLSPTAKLILSNFFCSF
jgi:hypothetical protein